MKYLKWVLCLLILVIVFFGINFTPKKYTRTEFMLDTVITITAYGKNAEAAVDKSFQRINEIEKKFSCYDTSSDVYKINSSGTQEETKIDSEVYDLIKKAVKYSEMTNGAFDISVKPLVDLWQIGSENAHVPNKSDIQNTLLNVGYKNILLNDENTSVMFCQNNMSIDLGGIAKGYAAQEAAKTLKENGITSAYADLGGNISVIGKKPLSLLQSIFKRKKSDSFIVGIQNPDKSRGEIIDKVTACDNFIVTSGGYERYFEQNGKRYHHILDTKTGYPAESGIKSVTVISKDGTFADMASTALYVMGTEGIDKLPKEMYDTIIFITENDETQYIKGGA